MIDTARPRLYFTGFKQHGPSEQEQYRKYNLGGQLLWLVQFTTDEDSAIHRTYWVVNVTLDTGSVQPSEIQVSDVLQNGLTNVENLMAKAIADAEKGVIENFDGIQTFRDWKFAPYLRNPDSVDAWDLFALVAREMASIGRMR